jgi:hypothetical protein
MVLTRESVVTVRLSSDEREMLSALEDADQVSASDVLRRLLREAYGRRSVDARIVEIVDAWQAMDAAHWKLLSEIDAGRRITKRALDEQHARGEKLQRIARRDGFNPFSAHVQPYWRQLERAPERLQRTQLASAFERFPEVIDMWTTRIRNGEQ